MVHEILKSVSFYIAASVVSDGTVLRSSTINPS